MLVRGIIFMVLPLLFACHQYNPANDWESERQARIAKDFTKTRAEVKAFIEQYIPDVSEAQLDAWEASRALEMKIINGQKRYFKYAARNLFRIDPQARKIWQAAHAAEKKAQEFDLDGHLRKVMAATKKSQNPWVLPVRFRIRYSIKVEPDAIPAGEVLRCWIPYPIKLEGRQDSIKLLSTEPQKHYLAPENQAQRTIYFEKKAKAGQSTEFEVQYAYTIRGTYRDIDENRVQPVTTTDGLEQWLGERPPHILFSDDLRELSNKIVGDETNPYRVAKKLFAWVDRNIPWASAREYSTVRNIPGYAITNGHGDCGMQTLLFITLCRINGIPARWQSGWEFKPQDDTMHDWGEIYFKPYGWMPMDVTYGLRETEDEALKFFYVNGMDSYRLIFNSDYSQPFDPPKQHFRSETIDSQRGEVEWRGGNLYFDKWSWNMEWEIIEPKL